MEYNIYAWASETTGVRGKITIMKGNRDDSGQKQAVFVCVMEQWSALHYWRIKYGTTSR